MFGNATLLCAAAATLARLPVDVLVASGSVALGELADLRRDRSWTVSGAEHAQPQPLHRGRASRW